MRKSLLVAAALSAGVLPADADAREREWEFTISARKTDPELWNKFSAMDPTLSTWDRNPTAVGLAHVTELSVARIQANKPWGRWGWNFSFQLPRNLETNAKAQSAAEQSKETSLWGFRLGPLVRWFPLGHASGTVQWFVGGRLGVGIFAGSQTFRSTTSGTVSYRAWASELTLSTGTEIKMGPGKFVFEGGYSRVRSSYFISTGTSGALYSDFPSGTRLAVANGAGSDDLRLDASGLFATVGYQIAVGGKATSTPDWKPESRAEDQATGEPAAEPTGEEQPSPTEEQPPQTNETQSTDEAQSPAESTPTPEPLPEPPPSPAPPWEPDPVPPSNTESPDLVSPEPRLTPEPQKIEPGQGDPVPNISP